MNFHKPYTHVNSLKTQRPDQEHLPRPFRSPRRSPVATAGEGRLVLPWLLTAHRGLPVVVFLNMSLCFALFCERHQNQINTICFISNYMVRKNVFLKWTFWGTNNMLLVPKIFWHYVSRLFVYYFFGSWSILCSLVDFLRDECGTLNGVYEGIMVPKVGHWYVYVMTFLLRQNLHKINSQISVQFDEFWGMQILM